MSEHVEELDLTKVIEDLNRAFEEFKATNDKRFEELKRSRGPDPLLEEKLGKVDATIRELEEKIERALAEQSRPFVADGGRFDEDLRRDLADFDLTRSLRYGAKHQPVSEEQFKRYSERFHWYLRRDLDGHPEFDLRRDLQVGMDPDGGFLVTPRIMRIMQGVVFESTPIRQLATVETISSDSVEVPTDNDEAGAGWVGETQTRAATTSPQLGNIVIPADEMYARPRATQRFLDDAGIDVEGWLGRKIGEKFARLEATAFVSGDGVQKPRGILSYPSGTSGGQIERITSANSGSITFDDLIECETKLKEEYRSDAVWLINRNVIGYIRKLKDSNGQYLWQPSTQAGQPNTLLGYPVRAASDLDNAVSSNNEVAIFGSVRRAYMIVDRAGVRTLRDPYTEKPNVIFYTTRRVGGRVVNFEAVKVLKVS